MWLEESYPRQTLHVTHQVSQYRGYVVRRFHRGDCHYRCKQRQLHRRVSADIQRDERTSYPGQLPSIHPWLRLDSCRRYCRAEKMTIRGISIRSIWYRRQREELSAALQLFQLSLLVLKFRALQVQDNLPYTTKHEVNSITADRVTSYDKESNCCGLPTYRSRSSSALESPKSRWRTERLTPPMAQTCHDYKRHHVTGR